MPGPEPNSPIFLDDDLDSLRAAVSKLKQEVRKLGCFRGGAGWLSYPKNIMAQSVKKDRKCC